MMQMQIKFLEGYTRNVTVVASGEMRLSRASDRKTLKFYLISFSTLCFLFLFFFTRSTCYHLSHQNEPVGQEDLFKHLQL